MMLQMVRAKRRQVLVDINTQRDFFLADGVVCIRNHRRVLLHVRRLMAWARRRDIPVVSTCEVYANHNSHNGDPRYCLDGTEGQLKVPYTLLNSRICFAADGSTDLPRDMLRRYQQVIFHKRCVDPFDEPRIDRVLSEVAATEFILIGATAEGAVKATALGLLQRDKKVSVVIDAVGYHDNREAKMAFRKMEAKGAKLIETRRLAGTSHLRLVGVCHCESCQRMLQKVTVGAPDDDGE
ncbi:MAG TPA: isochorismatase family protein [Sedimentisphaerales bacterium]|nr:isochorismatase family protein [Sedimentisphaerales bacterium]